MIEPELNQNVNFATKIGKYNVSSEVFVDFIFNEKCNCNCKFCIANIKNMAIEDIDVWKANTKSMFEVFDVHDMIILGGEATIDPKFFEKLDYIGQVMDQKERNIILTTNGVMLRNPAFLSRVCDSIITTINISYMHYDKAQNDAIMRGNTLTIDEIRTVRRVLNDHHMKLRLNSNVFRGNCDTVEEMIAYIDTFKDVADVIKFSPMIETKSFGSKDDVTQFTDTMALTQDQINTLYDELCTHGNIVSTNEKVFGYVRYKELNIQGCTVVLKYSQLSELFDKTKEIINLKMYPNGNLSNIWDSQDNSINALLSA